MYFSRLILLLFIIIPRLLSASTIYIDESTKAVDFIDHLFLAKDESGIISFDSIQKAQFRKYPGNANKVNLGHTSLIYWFKFIVENRGSGESNFIFGIENSNLDEVDIYEVKNGILTRKIFTGETRHIETRDLSHRHLLFKSKLKRNDKVEYFIRVNNNGDEMTFPLIFKKVEPYFLQDEKNLYISGMFNGLYLLIVAFTLYLFIRFKELVYLYYSLYALFSALFVLGGDGMLSFFLTPYFTVRIKMMFLHIALFFLVLFTQSFFQSRNRENIKFPIFLNILKIISLVGAVVTYAPYPYRLISIYIGTIMAPVIFISMIVVSIIEFKKEYFVLFYTLAFFISLSSVILYILYDYGYWDYSLAVDNSIKIGKSLEGVFLTYAVVERLKYIENLDKILLKDRSILIANQKETLQSINNELEKLSKIASETDNAIAIFDNNLKMEWCNIAFEKLYERKLESFLSKGEESLIDISKNSDIQEIVDGCLASLESVRYETKRKDSEDNDLWTQTTLTPFTDLTSNYIKLITIDTNITKQKQVQEELILSRDKAEESDRLKSAFLSNISHELRTPLNAILGFSELLMSGKADEQKRKRYLELVLKNGRNLLSLISDLIDISRIESGEIKLNVFMGDINMMIREVYEKYQKERYLIKEKGIIIKYYLSLKPEESTIYIDHRKVRQVLVNLMNNALKFTEKGEIELGYEVEDVMLKFYVRDTGIGISKEQQKLIFEEFRQVESGLSRKYDGTGLGLTLSKGLVTKMGGDIWVNSKLGSGSTFYFTVPFEYVEKDRSNARINEKRFDFKGKNILVVEDTEASKLFIQEILEDTGADLIMADTGRKALDFFATRKFDAILMDIRLPDISGYDVTSEIRTKNKDVFIIAQTANAMNDELSKCLVAGCNDYLPKPINARRLLLMLEQYFRNE